jgi:hypothetical protein
LIFFVIGYRDFYNKHISFFIMYNQKADILIIDRIKLSNIFSNPIYNNIIFKNIILMAIKFLIIFSAKTIIVFINNKSIVIINNFKIIIIKINIIKTSIFSFFFCID